MNTFIKLVIFLILMALAAAPTLVLIACAIKYFKS